MSYNQWNGDIGLATLEPQPVFSELYYPLWLYSGSIWGSNATSSGSSSLLQKAVSSGGQQGSSSNSDTHLYTHNVSWASNVQFAFEAAISITTSSFTAYFQLFDITSGVVVPGSQISTTSTTSILTRSGNFTLVQGHVYGITAWCNSPGYEAQLTDASLIIFPPTPPVSSSLSSVSLANSSGNMLKESYIPLWVYSSGTASTAATSPGNFLQKGSTSLVTGTSSSAIKFFTMDSSWSNGQKFALEASLCGTSGLNNYAQLWDMNTNSGVTGGYVSTTSGTTTLVRSTSFSLISGHSYGVSFWNPSPGTVYISKAHLVALAN